MVDTAVDIEKLKSYGTKDYQVTAANVLNCTECDWLDFKSEWYKNNCDLLFDILCFCNSITDSKNRFLVIGIKEYSDTKKKEVLGVDQDQNRKTDEDIERLLHDYFYIQPNIEVYPLQIEGKTVDVIRITPNSAVLPYHLQKKYDKQGKFGKILLKNTIYARNGKTNYPIDEGVPHFLIQQLFAIRTGHHLTTRERGFLYLDDMENWIFANPEQIYYDLDCAFKILVDKSESHPNYLNRITDYANLLTDTFLGTDFWKAKNDPLSCSMEEHYDCYKVRLMWHGNELFSFSVVDILMKHFPLCGYLKRFFVPAALGLKRYNENEDPYDTIPQSPEYKICCLLFRPYNDGGDNDEVLNYLNWDYLRCPTEYLKLNPWIYDKRDK